MTGGLAKLKTQPMRRSMLGKGSKDLISNLPKLKIPKTSEQIDDMIQRETSRYDEDYILEPIHRLQKNCRVIEKKLESQKP